jgi:excisionase family DNA binding protein
MQTKTIIVPAMLTVRETMNYSRLGRNKIFDMLKTGELPRTKVGGKTLISKSALDKLLGLDTERVS